MISYVIRRSVLFLQHSSSLACVVAPVWKHLKLSTVIAHDFVGSFMQPQLIVRDLLYFFVIFVVGGRQRTRKWPVAYQDSAMLLSEKSECRKKLHLSVSQETQSP